MAKEMPKWLEKELMGLLDHTFIMDKEDPFSMAKAVKNKGIRKGFKKCFELTRSRCFCGAPMLAGSEDFPQPLCDKHYYDYLEKTKPRPISEYDKEKGEDVLLYCSDGYCSLEIVGGWYEGQWETPSDKKIDIPPIYFVPIQKWPEKGKE